MSLYKHIQIDEALKEHEKLIAKIRENCKEFIAKDEAQFNDDIFILRFCISQKGDYEKTYEAFTTTINWRVENREKLKKYASGWIGRAEKILKFLSPTEYHKHAKDGSPILIVRPGLSQPDLILKTLTEEEIIEAVTFSKEKIYQELDRESRRRGYFVKIISINDYKRASIFGINWTLLGIFAKASKTFEKTYPQFVGKTVITNPLSTFKAIMPLARAIFPASTLDKVQFCGGSSTVTGQISECPLAKHCFDVETALPTFLGGGCSCPGGCVNSANDRKDQVNEDDLKAYLKVLDAEEAKEKEQKMNANGGDDKIEK